MFIKDYLSNKIVRIGLEDKFNPIILQIYS